MQIHARSLFFFLVTILSSAAVFGAPLSGTVVDESGRALPRALVVVFAASGETVGTTFTYPDGSFRVEAERGCRVEASLSGFQTGRADCSSGDLRLVLAVAPVQESIVVSATRTEVPSGQLAASISVFDAGEIARRQNPPLGDLLRSAPGVIVVGNGSRGAVASMFLRGGESNYTKILLDGIPLNEPGGTFDFGSVTTENIGRVELVRGAQSALFGSDAMAGVVQLFTARAAAGGPHASAAFEGGSFGTARVSAGASGRTGVLDYSVAAARYTTDNEVPNDRFEDTTLSSSVGLQLNERTTLRFTGRGELGSVGTPGQALFGRPDLDASFERHNGVGGVTYSQAINPSFSHRATYALAITRQASTNLLLDPPYTPAFEGRSAPFEFFDFAYDSRNDLRRHYASYQADWRLPRPSARAGTHVMTFAVDWDGERAVLADRLAGSSTHARRNNFGWTLQDQAMWSRVFVTGGLRVEDNDSFGAAVVPRGSIAVIAHRSTGAVGDTKLKASAGLGIKEPTLLQSFSLSPFFLGNPSLDPERSRSLEAGVEQRFLGDRGRIEVTWFANRYRDIIATRTISFDPYTSQYFNIGLTRARGAEISGEVAPAAGVLVRAGYTRLDSKILDSSSLFSPVFEPGRPLFRRPRNSGYAGLAWTMSRVSLDVSAVIVGARSDSDFASLEPPLLSNDGYATLDVRGSVTLTRHLALTGAVDNLGGAEYMDPLGYPALGRAARLGARFGF